MSSKKVPPSQRVQISPGRNFPLELSLRVPSCPRAPSTTYVPAELRLNRANVGHCIVQSLEVHSGHWRDAEAGVKVA
jgi:hypothetical protein